MNRDPELARRLNDLGLTAHQTAQLLPEVGILDPEQLGFALELAAGDPTRAAEALRIAAEVLPRLGADWRLALAAPAKPVDAALSCLRALPELRPSLGPKLLAAWVALVATEKPGAASALAQRSPRLLAGLPRRALPAGLALVRTLAPELGGMLPTMARVVEAVQGRRRPALLLGLALNLAQERPSAALGFLEDLEEGPAQDLAPAQLARWSLGGLRRERAGAVFFGRQRAGQAEADRLSAAFSLERCLPWLSLYASLHAGRELRLAVDSQRWASEAWIDTKRATDITLPRRLESLDPPPERLARALAVLGAAARAMGLFDLSKDQVSQGLQGLGYRAPYLQELAPPKLFCAAFPSPAIAAALLALAVESQVAAGPARRMPGLARDLAELRRHRREHPPAWPGLEGADRCAALCAHYLAQGERPAQVLPRDHDCAQAMVDRLHQAPASLDAAGIMALTGELYALLPDEAPPLPPAHPGLPYKECQEMEGRPPTPLSNMPGAAEQALPQPWHQREAGQAEPNLGVYYYPEWDPDTGRTSGRSTILERPVPPGDTAELDAALDRHRGLAHQLRRAFLALAPEGPAWQGRCDQGSELDLDNLVRERCDLAVGVAPEGRVFRRRRPKVRSVSCGVLWDVSGSTRHHLERGGGGHPVAAASRLALALFAGALDASGDDYALWGYSGIGSGRVDFYRLWDFDQARRPGLLERLAGLTPLAQNRDGAAIRHAAALLSRRPARSKLLIIITDGRPDDYGYGPEVSSHDLPLALAGARSRGVRPAALLITPEGRTPHKAYQAIPHVILRELDGLARWLPRLYHRFTT